MEIVQPIINTIVNTTMVPVTNHISYLISSKKYVRDMHTKVTELDVARVGVEDHINRNKRRHLQVPTQVKGWLEEVEKIRAKVGNIPNDVGSCWNLKIKHNLGRKAFKIIEEIDSAIRKRTLINWTDDPIPLGRVDSVVASTSTPSSNHNNFHSREHIFTEALRALEPSNESHMIALWGMGGVGKTTTMQKLKKVVKEKKMFNYYVEAVVGEKTDPIAIQDAVAEYLDIKLTESTKSARAEKIRQWFKDNLHGNKTRLLIILDDVWEFVDMNDIGLSHLPNQGVDFKVLLTSRDRAVCITMGVEVHSIFNVEVLPETEAQSFFYEFVKDSDLAILNDPALRAAFRAIGDRIVNRCQGLPIAIKTIAYTVKGRSKQVWEDTLARLEHHDIDDIVPEVFKISYNNLQHKETESIFLLCGLFPEDFNIPKEDLLKYGWGLKLFKSVSNIREARNRLNTCIERLMHTNLLIQSDNVWCVKMHDLTLAFVLDMFSKAERDPFVNHSNILEWPANDMSKSCKSISLTCKGMTEIPRYLKFPSLSMLKLMHGDKSLRFPKDFYGKMEKLQVISIDKLKYPLFPSSLNYSMNLRVLYLHECSLIFDCSSIGNLLNLEVLSFANSGIEWLPSAIRNLKKLRLLDLTGCVRLRIDNGVLKDLVKLEELYIRVADGIGIIFTEDNCNEMAAHLKRLSSLEFEFFKNNVQPKNISFEKLERFKISVGRYLDTSTREDADFSKRWEPHENNLQLKTNKDDLVEAGLNRLFKKTEVLWLEVDDMNDLADVEVKSSHAPQSSSFYNLRVLVMSSCSDLKYLFTLGVAKALSNLERLEVWACPIMEALIHTNGSEEDTITFPKLKVLHLETLAKFSGVCNNVNIIELPQLLVLRLGRIPNFTSIYPGKNESGASCMLREEIVIPKLEELIISSMDNLKEIWPCDFTKSKGNVSMLKEIQVSGCDDVVNLFPSNPMPFFHHLEQLMVYRCGSIEVFFNIDLDCVGEIEEVISSSSRLRVIHAEELGKLREVWRVKGENKSGTIPMTRGFQAVEKIWIQRCKRFRDVFTPNTTNFDLWELRDLSIENCGESWRNNELAVSGEEQEEEETSEANASISSVVFPSYQIPSFCNLRNLGLNRYEGVQEVVFEIKGSSSTELVTTTTTITRDDSQQRQLLPYLENLDICYMNRMTHVWKLSRNDFLMLQKQPSDQSPFHNLKAIHLENCNSIKYLFSNLMAKLLSNLKKINITYCEGIGEVVSNKDEENTASTSTSTNTSTTMFLHLDSLKLIGLGNLKCIDGGAEYGNNETSSSNTTITNVNLDLSKISHVGGISWFLCQYSRRIYISCCNALPSVIPYYALGQTQNLQELDINYCLSMKEVFETQGINNNIIDVYEGDGGARAIPRLNNVTVHKLPNLKILKIFQCSLLENVFTFSALESLRQLEELKIENCKALKVIVMEEKHEVEQTTTSSKVVVFPRLKSIELVSLPELVGFFLGMNEFQWPALDKVMIADCPQMTVFAPGGSTTPKLKYMHTSLGKHSLECGLNFHVTTIMPQTQLSSLGSTSSCLPTSEGKPWSFQNLINLDMKWHNAFVEKIIPSSEFLQLQKLQTLRVKHCDFVEEVFEALEGTNSSSDASQTTVVKLPNLTQLDLQYLPHFRYIWRSNRWTVYEFPKLTKVSIVQCNKLEHVFISSVVRSLVKLQELHISYCHFVKVIVKDTSVVEEEEEKSDHGIMNDIMLPHLRSLELVCLPSLQGFCFRKEDFSFPLLNTLRIEKCPAITTFTMGNSSTPELEGVETSFGSFDVKEDDINTFIKTKQEEFKHND